MYSQVKTVLILVEGRKFYERTSISRDIIELIARIYWVEKDIETRLNYYFTYAYIAEARWKYRLKEINFTSEEDKYKLNQHILEEAKIFVKAPDLLLNNSEDAWHHRNFKDDWTLDSKFNPLSITKIIEQTGVEGLVEHYQMFSDLRHGSHYWNSTKFFRWNRNEFCYEDSVELGEIVLKTAIYAFQSLLEIMQKNFEFQVK